MGRLQRLFGRNGTTVTGQSTTPAPAPTPSPRPQPRRYGPEFLLSRYVVIGAFVFIAVMLAVHFVTLQSTLNMTLNSAKSPNSSLNISDIKDIIDRVDTSNQTIFNILLPVFGAWVGVVIAFYFGTQQAKNTQDTLVKALSQEEKLSTTKVQALLDKFPSTKEIHKAKLDNTINEVKKASVGVSDVLIVKDVSDEPLGILYLQDLNNVLPSITDPDKGKISESDGKKLADVIGNIPAEFITKGKWDKDKGVMNFAKAKPDDTLLVAKSKMDVFAEHASDIRCVITDAAGRPVGIFSYDSIAAFMKS